jgi:YidC/Oxa1 family membrane protein insertase
MLSAPCFAGVFMRLTWLFLFLVSFTVNVSSAVESAVTPVEAPAAATVSKPIPPTSPTITAPVYAQHRLANELVEVQISELQGSIKSMGLVNEKPIRLRAWQEQALKDLGRTPPEFDKSLLVLNDFQTKAGKHNWIGGIGLPSSNAPAWKVLNSDAQQITLGYTNNDKQVAYRLTYHLPANSLVVRTTLTVENLGKTTFSLQPYVYPLNGIHQDDLSQDAAYLALVYHAGGAAGKMNSLYLPPVNGRTEIPKEQIDYVCLKSRFFAALWHPISFRVGDIKSEILDASVPTPAPAPAAVVESGGPSMKPGDLSSPNSTAIVGAIGNIHIVANGYLDRNKAHQALVGVTYLGTNNGDVVLGSNQKMEIAWTLTVASMRKVDVERLDPIAAKVEYSDGYYRFFKSLAWLLTISLDTLVLVVNNYGLAVVVLTLLIKLLLHRTTFKQHESMMKMQKLAPDLKLLQETYKNDKQKMAQKQMELWKKHGVNPLGGCLPILIQIPIFTALYLAFCHSADMRGHGFLWINDLTLPDQLIGWVVGGWTLSFNLLPIIYIGVSVWMSLMQKMPTGGDPQQEQMMKIMRWMPVMMGVIFYNFPSGLVLYFTINAVLSTIEIKMVRKKLGMT